MMYCRRKCDTKKRLRHLQGVWERKLGRKLAMKTVVYKNGRIVPVTQSKEKLIESLANIAKAILVKTDSFLFRGVKWKSDKNRKKFKNKYREGMYPRIVKAKKLPWDIR